MNAEQKQQAKQLIADWTNVSKTSTPAVWFLNGDCMAGFLQELVDAHEQKPVAYATGYYAGCLSIATVDGSVLPAGTALYAAPPHQSEHHLEMVNTPAPSVPVKPMENIALNEWLDKTEWVQKELNTFPVSSLGMHRADVMRLEIERLRKLLSAAPTPADLVRDAEPWKLLLENLVEGLNKTHWSSWQGTAHFDEYLQEAISAIERDKQKGGEA